MAISVKFCKQASSAIILCAFNWSQNKALLLSVEWKSLPHLISNPFSHKPPVFFCACKHKIFVLIAVLFALYEICFVLFSYCSLYLEASYILSLPIGLLLILEVCGGLTAKTAPVSKLLEYDSEDPWFLNLDGFWAHSCQQNEPCDACQFWA